MPSLPGSRCHFAFRAHAPTYLPQDAPVMARAEGRDDARALRVSVKPLLTDAAFSRVAAVDRRGGINVLAAPLTQQDPV